MLKFDNCLIENGAFQLKADFQIMPLSSVAIIGPSGSGKSTLLEALAGFRSLTHGALLWKDQDLTSLHPGKRPIAMLFQDGNLFPHLTVFQNVALGMQANKRLTNEEVSQIEMALVRVGLADMGLRKPAELSGGQRSRVALARVLVQRRELLLLDEPFAALGPALKAEMLDLVADLAKETDTTVLMVSHDPNDARRIASQTVLVAEGVAHQPQATEELLDNPPAVLRDYLGGA